MNPDQLERYSRHLLLPHVGRQGQERLLRGRVLLVGVGGLGSPAALYLAAAGVGTLGLVDADRVDLSNLQRQVLHETSSVGMSKLESARTRLHALNPDLNIELHEGRLTSANALDILGGYDVVVDGSDNFPTRYLTNDACVFLGKPNVYGALQHFDGQASVFWPAGGGACYRCLFPEPPPPGAVPTCAEAGVLGVLPGVIGTLQATEAVKLLLEIGEPLVGRLLLYDALAMEFRTVRLRRNPECPVCGDNPTVRDLVDYEHFCGGGGKGLEVAEVSARELREQLAGDPALPLLDVRNPDEFEAGHLPGAKLIPLGELQKRLGELEQLRGGRIVVYCKGGGRSARACELLREAGFRVENLRGGYMAWESEPVLP